MSLYYQHQQKCYLGNFDIRCTALCVVMSTLNAVSEDSSSVEEMSQMWHVASH